MPIDASIPLSGTVPNPMSSLSSIMGVAATAQYIKSSRIQQQLSGVALQQAQGALDARNAMGPIISDQQYRDPTTGLIDMDRLAPAIIQADPKNYVASDVISSMAKYNNDLISVKKSALGLADTSRAMLGSTVGSLATKPDLSKADVSGALDQLATQAPDTTPIINVWKRHLDAMPDNPKALQQAVMQARAQVMPAGGQIAAQTPSGVVINDGRNQTLFNTSAGYGPPGPVAGVSAQNQLPPTTQAYNPATKAMEYIGAQPGAAPGAPQGAPRAPMAPPGAGAPPGAAASSQIPPSVQNGRNVDQLRILQDERANEVNNPDPVARARNLAQLDSEIFKASFGHASPPSLRVITPPAPSRVQAGPGLGVPENVAGTVDAVNKDWSATVASASSAAQDIGVLQNIKQYAAGAVMGVGSDYRAMITGWAGLLHMDPAQLAKTNTDLLAKNTTMLALAGGDTNLARTMATMMNPNSHMTPEAATDAANQLIAQRKLVIAKQQYMSHFKGDPDQYSKELANFNQIADPRALQVNDMSDAEIGRMKASMSPSEQAAFGGKLRKMQAIGLIQ